jgi:hypothetical protein
VSQRTHQGCYERAMRVFVVGLAIAVTLGVAACGSDDSPGDAGADDAATEATATGGSVSPGVPDVIGDTVEDATATLEAAGFSLRVVQRDGEDLPVTADFIDNRVNVAVETQQYGEEVVTAVVSTG